MCNACISGITIKDVIKESGVQITEENLLQLKYDRKSVWGYVEVWLWVLL